MAVQRLTKKIVLFYAAAFAFPVSAAAASFDCAKAHSDREKLICETPELSALDEKLSASYTNIMKSLSKEGKEDVQKGQIAWLKSVSTYCSSEAVRPLGTESKHDKAVYCLKEAFQDRQQHLDNTVTIKQGLVIRRVDLSREHRSDDDFGHHSGFVTHSYSYPQIDHATNKNDIEWNRIMFKKSHLDEYDSGDSSDTDVTIDFHIASITPDIISVVLEDYYYPHEAAHGDGSTRTYTWLRNQGRELIAEDIFDPCKDWKDAFGKYVFKALQDFDKNRNQYYELQYKIVAGLATDIKNWSFTEQGITVHFDPYTLGAGYAPGYPEVVIPWQQARDYFSKTAPVLFGRYY